MRDDIRVRALHPRGPVRNVVAATPRGGALPAAQHMLTVLDKVAHAYRTHGPSSVAQQHVDHMQMQ